MFNIFNKALKFTKHFYKQLEQQQPGLELLQLEELHLKTLYNSNTYNHYLNNAYSEYSNATNKQEKKEVIESYIKSALSLYQSQQSFSEENIVPVIKDYRYLEEIQQHYSTEKKLPIHEPYNELLYIFYAQDKEHSISYLNPEDIEQHGINLDGLRARALHNLFPKLPSIEIQGGEGFYMIIAGGNYEASLLLDANHWTKEDFPVLGEWVIAVPSRDLLLITGHEDSHNIARMQDIVQDIQQTGNHLVSDQLFIYKNGTFEWYQPQ